MQKHLDHTPSTCHESTQLATNTALPMIPAAQSASISPALSVDRVVDTTQDCSLVSGNLFISGPCFVEEAGHGNVTLR